MIDLLLQIMRVVIAYPLGQNQANEAAGAARHRTGGNGCCQRTARGDDGPNRGHRANVEQPVDQPPPSASPRDSVET